MFPPALSLFCLAVVFILGHPKQMGSTPIDTTMQSNQTNPLTSHVLDQAIGRPAAGVRVLLFKQENGQWRQISEQLTNDDGRIGNIISAEEFTPAIYRLNFDTLSYYQRQGQKTFYPFIDIVFEIERPDEHYHVPILLSAYGFSTYRGS